MFAVSLHKLHFVVWFGCMGMAHTLGVNLMRVNYSSACCSFVLYTFLAKINYTTFT